jgi:NADP-dependent 3-hydroxy acid dehydrogenase YdfG
VTRSGQAKGGLIGRTAVVTGASRGIGQATARALTDAGCRVVGLSRSGAPRAAEQTGAHAWVIVDLTDPTAIADAVQAVFDRLGVSPDLLINNAGAFTIAPIADTSPDMFARMLAVNLAAPFQLIRAFLPGMRDRGIGHVVTVGSIADHVAFPGNSAYSAAKFGLRGLHEVLRAELKGTGVRTTLVSPEAVDTAVWDELDPVTRDQFPPSTEMLAAEDVAGAILYAITRPASVNVDEIRVSTT